MLKYLLDMLKATEEPEKRLQEKMDELMNSIDK